MARKSFPIAVGISTLALAPFMRSVRDTERIPDGPFLAVSNHSSFMDGVVLANEFAWAMKRPLHVISVEHPFRHWLFGWVLRSGRAISLDRSAHDTGLRMMQDALGYLRMGEPVALFPEGHVNKGTRMRKLRPGAALLALESGVPILPVGIRGSSQVLPFGTPYPRLRRCVEVNIGTPLFFTEESAAYQSSPRRERWGYAVKILNRLATEIAALAGQEPPKHR